MKELICSNQARAEALQKNNPFLTAHQIVYTLLRDDIIACYIKPDTRLTEEQCATLYNTSRSTIRKVFDRLVDEGWLHRSEGHRIRVSGVSWDDHLQMMEYRMALEPTAARLAARNRTRAELQRIEQYSARCDTEDIHTLYINDRKFHRAVFAASHNRYLIEESERIDPIIARAKLHTSSSFQELCKECYLEHNSIYEAIREGDESAAHKRMFQHIKMMLDVQLK